MSRFDYSDPGTDPAYCDGLQADDDTDIPDFDQPDPPVDPGEVAAVEAFLGLVGLREQINEATDLDRVLALRKLARQVWEMATQVCDRAAARCDEDLERRR